MVRKKKILLIFLILLIIGLGLGLGLGFGLSHKETYPSFTEYNNFKYSPKLSVQNIKNLKEGQKKMSNMLKEFDRICRKYNIKYFLIGGSLIGALAYKGWIPWDGDVDLEICEEDYPKFKSVIQKELPKDMWFQDSNIDSNYKDIILGKLRDLNSCYTDYPYIGKESHQGLQMDVNIYKEKKGRIYFPDNRAVTYLTKDDVYPIKRVPFEDFEVCVMNNSEKYLVNNYGKKWYKDLPIKDRYAHEGRIDPNKTCPFHYSKYPQLYKS